MVAGPPMCEQSSVRMEQHLGTCGVVTYGLAAFRNGFVPIPPCFHNGPYGTG